MDDLTVSLQEASTLIQAGRFVEAERLLGAAVHRNPANPDVWFLLGVARHLGGELESSLKAFDECSGLEVPHPQARSARAAVLSDLGRNQEAESAYRELVISQPDNAQLHLNLGIVFERLEDPQAALRAYDRALELAPDFPSALNNRAILLSGVGRFDDALSSFDRLVATHPDYPDYHFNRAELLFRIDLIEESLAAADSALACDPRHVSALLQRGLALSVTGRLAEAEQAFSSARQIDPAGFRAFRNPFDAVHGDNEKGLDSRLIYLEYLYAQQTVCNWSRHDEYIRNFATLIGESLGTPREIGDPRLPFRALSFPMRDEVRAGLAASVARAVVEFAGTGNQPARRMRSRTGERIRIGYVSPDFRIHPTAFLMRPVYELHDRRRFDVFAYSLWQDDGSEIRKHVERSVDVFRDMWSLADGEIAERISADAIDVLVDQAGYTNFARAGIFARRPVPLQVSYLGFPGTLGAAFMDYALVDRYVCPLGVERYWTEKLVYMPHCYFVASNPERGVAGPVSRASAGLPENAPVLCCFNNAHKIEPVMFSIWMRVLRAAPQAVLWILVLDERVKANLRFEAAARGVDPGRLVFAPFWTHERHLGRMAHADLMLDTLYYNAHTTAMDALGAGVPVLTCPGSSMPSRVAASLLTAIGMPEMIAGSLEEYERRAVSLANDREELARLKRKLRDNYRKTPLFDTQGFVRDLELAFETMVARGREGLPPVSFDVIRKS